ncbi:hypothetical protein ACFSKU_09805 [Pontibacter silvestris]|uniref:Uncharacterized protein n=1 Tax=Pontibacter silvestris TaxID=2305183 RepID=A0ABW4WYA3_9BACT|nr:hypothetical protein [Pontibacter silvestris]MCC9136868.1 hypothetical protein [Pontibacter silvestris]
MNTKMSLKHLSNFVKRHLNSNMHSMWIAMVAVACSFLVQSEQLDYAYPLELLLKGVVNDATVVSTDH